MRVGLVTCLTLPEPDPDEAPLLEALRRGGHEPILVPWDRRDNSKVQSRSNIDTRRFDLFILRSTWNYYHAPDAFLTWVDRTAVEVPLINPPHVVHWNIHKRYLRELQQHGVPIVPTRWFNLGTAVKLASLVTETGWEKLVIKPAISAGSFKTRVFSTRDLDDAQMFLDALLVERDALVQCYLDGFREPGERSLIWIDGEWTHTVRKHPRYSGQDERVEPDEAPRSAERGIADAAIHNLRDRLTYARVDLVLDNDHNPVVSEVELIEPSLFFNHSPHALDRFVRALEKRCPGSHA